MNTAIPASAAGGLDDAPIRWLVDDCTKFVERELRRGNRRAVEELGIEDCTQCTCCSYICPSRQSVAGEILLYRQKMKGGEEP